MSQQSDAEFTAATHAELARLTTQAAQLRRNRPAHAWCPDQGGCRPCRAIRDVHRQIDDFLLQLEGRPAEDPHLLAVAFYTPGAHGDPLTLQCNCGRKRWYLDGFLVCESCDAGTVPLAELMDGEDA